MHVRTTRFGRSTYDTSRRSIDPVGSIPQENVPFLDKVCVRSLKHKNQTCHAVTIYVYYAILLPTPCGNTHK